MSRRSGALAHLLCAAWLFASAGAARAQGDDRVACDQAARDAEAVFGLPPGILVAIGSVESGHWPWTANVDGAAEIYPSKAEAVAALQRERSPRPFDVDVGCFQISLHYHPTAFATMQDALDPAANARYAARFLLELRDRYGDWDRAVGAYHSATGALADAYRARTLAAWKSRPEDKQPEVVAIADQPRWRVISIADSLRVASPGGLPRVITISN